MATSGANRPTCENPVHRVLVYQTVTCFCSTFLFQNTGLEKTNPAIIGQITPHRSRRGSNHCLVPVITPSSNTLRLHLKPTQRTNERNFRISAFWLQTVLITHHKHVSHTMLRDCHFIYRLVRSITDVMIYAEDSSSVSRCCVSSEPRMSNATCEA